MKYGPNIVKQICDELGNVPNIRYVCKKFGIDHSTFYRWMSRHHKFYQDVTASLIVGRRKICDAAEGVIINGIQNNDYRCSVYFLSHNDGRYINTQRISYLEHLNRTDLDILKEKPPDDSKFEALFDQYFLFEIGKTTSKKAKKLIDPFVKNVFSEDPALEEIFHAAYAEWKKNKIERWEKMNEASKLRYELNPECNKEGFEPDEE